MHVDYVPAGQIAGIEAAAVRRLCGPEAIEYTTISPLSKLPPVVLVVNSTALPPGSTCGQRCVVSPACLSSVVSGWAFLPLRRPGVVPKWYLWQTRSCRLRPSFRPGQ